MESRTYSVSNRITQGKEERSTARERSRQGHGKGLRPLTGNHVPGVRLAHLLLTAMANNADRSVPVLRLREAWQAAQVLSAKSVLSVSYPT